MIVSDDVGPAPAVMHLIDTGGPGGAETVFSQLALNVGAGRIRAVPVVPREGWLSGNLRALGLQPLIVPAHGSFNIRYLCALAKVVSQHKVRLIHAHLLGSAVYAALVGFLTRKPVIAVIHGPTDLRSAGRLAFLKRWLLAHGCAQIVAVSTSTREALIDFGIDPASILLIQNAVDTDAYCPGHADDLRRHLGLAPTDLLIGAVGNIRSPKAYDVLLNAASLLLKRKPSAFFAVIGEGDERQIAPLLEQRARLGIEARFQFLGFRKSSSELLRNFDVFVSSSRTEGLSLSFLEAMATGRAIVATRSGGAQEAVVDAASGLLVPIEDPAQLADALERVLGDPQLRQRLGAAARERAVQSFSMKSMTGKYEALYSKLLR